MIFGKRPTHEQPFTRTSLAWLLAVQIFIVAPHFVTAPAWIAFIWVMVAFWRWRIFQGAWNYPNKLKKTLLVIFCCAGLLLSMGASFRFESMVSLLIIGFTLKLLELKNKKDFVLLIFIAFFILSAQFVEFNNFLAAFYSFGCLVLLYASLMQLYKKSERSSIWASIRPSVAILLQAIPFMLILFVVVPRLGSFWVVPTPQHAKTGMSDSMSPGDFTELMESDELAFRVSFLTVIPAREQLYWRSLVFSFFDGRRWTQNPQQKIENYFNQASKNLHSHVEYKGNQLEYEVVAEASAQPWLYVLAAPRSWSNNIAFMRDMRVQAFSPVTERMSYHVISALNYQLNELNADELTQNLQLPKGGNLKTRERAKEWLAETGNTEKLIEKLFSYYHQRFFYTLKPPPLGVDVVDDFLWNTRQGFCEHFSSSFVFFMRAAGIPARVVVGYQGGDINSVDNSLTVRQRDAHAWAEVWLDGRGWLMFDPTAAVAPERVQKGIEQSLSATDRQFLAKPFGSSLKVLLRMREQWDAVNLKWIRWVMNYDSSSQAALLAQLLGDVSPMRIAILVVVSGGGFGVLLFAWLMLRSRKQNLSDTALIYLQLCKKLKAHGFIPHAHETPREFVNRVAASKPELRASLVHLIDLYERWAYGEEAQVEAQLRKEIRNFRP
jgi:transglutaminase-like putative cysteine protease